MKTYKETLESVIKYAKIDCDDIVGTLFVMGFTPRQLIYDFGFDKEDVLEHPDFKKYADACGEYIECSKHGTVTDENFDKDSSLAELKNEILAALKARISDDLAAGADSAEYLETTIYKVLEEVFDAKCVPMDTEANITAIILDAEEYFKLGNVSYPEDFEESMPHKKYVFKTPKEFVEHWYDLPEGNWYWVFHAGELICSGAIDPNDIEIFEEHFGTEFVSPDEIEEVKSCVASMLEDFDLGGVEITDDDYNTIIKRVSDSDELNPLERIVKEYLWEIREVLDNGLAESLPDTVRISAADLDIDTESVYQDQDEKLTEVTAELTKANVAGDFVEDEIYPLTIVSDRYTGAYSGGQYTAWNISASELPDGIDGDDTECMAFWRNNTIPVGKGRTGSEALANLYIQLKNKKDDEANVSGNNFPW